MGKILWIIIIFLVIGGFIIKSSLDTDFSESSDRKSFAKELFSWLGQVFSSTRSTVGYAIDQDWLPETNKTNSTHKVFEILD